MRKLLYMLLGAIVLKLYVYIHDSYTDIYNNSNGRYTIDYNNTKYTCINDQYGRECYDKNGIILGDELYFDRRKRMRERG